MKRRETLQSTAWCRAILPCVVLLILSQAASAQITSAQQDAIKSSCRSDYMAKCSSVKPGGAEALQCLQKNVAKLSPVCQTAVNAATPKHAVPTAATAPPPPKAATPLPSASGTAIVNSPPPPARMAKPSGAMIQPPATKTPAPPAPKQAIIAPPAPTAAAGPPQPSPKQLNAIKVTCRGDFTRNCRGVQPGGAEAIACLQRSASRLSPTCKTSLADIANAVPATPAAATAAPPPPATRRPNRPVVMTAAIGRACLRDLALHCRNTGVGDGQKIACLMARGPKLAPLCKAALKITKPVR